MKSKILMDSPLEIIRLQFDFWPLCSKSYQSVPEKATVYDDDHS